jgi:hypothetical protein
MVAVILHPQSDNAPREKYTAATTVVDISPQLSAIHCTLFCICIGLYVRNAVDIRARVGTKESSNRRGVITTSIHAWYANG